MTTASAPSLVPVPSPLGLADPLAALLLGVAGGALLGARRGAGSRARAAATVGGLALIGAVAHRPLAEGLRRMGMRRRAASITTSFVVRHPVNRVFAFCRDFENFPRFIGALREVRDFGDGRSRWCASTPSGGIVEWDAITTKYVPNSVIAWESTGRSPVRARATVRFTPEDDNVTCVEVSASYCVMDSGLKDALLALTTRRRQQEVQADIQRLASYLDATLVPAPEKA